MRKIIPACRFISIAEGALSGSSPMRALGFAESLRRTTIIVSMITPADMLHFMRRGTGCSTRRGST